MKKMDENDVIRSRNFGGVSPYYFTDESGSTFVADNFPEIAQNIPEHQRVIDPVAVLELFCFNYVLGDRTILKDLYRLPWHSELSFKGEVLRKNPIKHGYALQEPKDIAIDLIACLKKELLSYIDGRDKVFLLLSGGFDSRISACVLKEIEKENNLEVIALTWGDKDSRDVVYSTEISKIMDWQWIHLDYRADDLWNNMEIASTWGGGEVAAVHYHAMDKVKTIVNTSDLIIASSWGDSIGRAEFSGKHLPRLSRPKIENKHFLVKRSIANDCMQSAQNDMALAWSSEPDQSETIMNELHMQENYMRRMIGHAMNYLGNFCTVEQSFTADETVAKMWSLNPVCRTNGVYFEVFKRLNSQLYDFPWARTGIAPSGRIDERLFLKKKYHSWGAWMRTDLKPQLKSLILDGGLKDLGIFNMGQVESVFNLWTKEGLDSLNYNETILKLGLMEMVRRNYNVKHAGDVTSLSDRVFSKAYYYAKKYR
jgi:asparagine synthase (glutamine-hydrolysing)